MKREVKKIYVEELKNELKNAKAAILANYQGMTVAQMTGLRKKLNPSQAKLKVLKNRLVKLAVQSTDYQDLSTDLTGTNVLGYTQGDSVSLVKAFVELDKEEDNPFKLKVGFLEGKRLTVDEIKQIAKLPAREELLAQFLCVLQGPMRGLVTVLSGVPRNFVQVLSAISQQKEKGDSTAHKAT